MSETSEEDKSQKTEEATPHRLQKAFEKGQVALSKEINNWFILAAATLMILIALPFSLSYLKESLLPFISHPHLLIQQYTSFQDIGHDLAVKTLIALSFPLSIIIVFVVMAVLLQTRLSIAWDAFKPKLERISPLKGLGRIFSKKSLLESIKGLLKLIIIGLAIFFVIRQKLSAVPDWITIPVDDFFTVTQSLILSILTVILSILFIIAGLDYLFQKFDFLKNLRMSPEEIKKEFKELEGDPLIKQRLRRLREDMIRQNMISAVPKATAIITNPTHFSVAIHYESDTMHAPIVIAKGQDFLAFKIREIATEHKIPIFEDPPLARTLYAHVDVNQEIAPEHYQAVANIIRLVMNMKKQYF